MLAYLDVGSGSVIVAAFAGGVAGIGLLFRLYWHRVLGVFSKKHRLVAKETAESLIGASDDETEATRPSDG